MFSKMNEENLRQDDKKYLQLFIEILFWIYRL